MSDKELYQQLQQAQLNEWLIEVDRLKIIASWLKADIQQGINKQIKMLEDKIKEGNAKLSQLAETGEEAWQSIKHILESAYVSLKFAVSYSATELNE